MAVNAWSDEYVGGQRRETATLAAVASLLLTGGRTGAQFELAGQDAMNLAQRRRRGDGAGGNVEGDTLAGDMQRGQLKSRDGREDLAAGTGRAP